LRGVFYKEEQKLNIFIGMKVPRENAELRQAADLLAAAVLDSGHTPFVATDEIAKRSMRDPRIFMPFVRQQIQHADLVIILNHPELRGGLIEAGIAYAWDIPLWLCCRAGERVSSSMRGCADIMIEYETLDDLRDQLSSLLMDKSRFAGFQNQ
jgi:nucleoside 2-deoxyribosyltransferase